ncbi:hypothetical protein SAMN05443252_10445 [Bacillus sp. OV322]|nr:hypothetical protein [Bacillus sp. OV322]SFC51496.1 hypothetical protein SAMN05443252_10445 [Bacillus sp. OV322]
MIEKMLLSLSMIIVVFLHPYMADGYHHHHHYLGNQRHIDLLLVF